MELPIQNIENHKQVTPVSCIPMSVECVIKLLGQMDQLNFSLQEDSTKSGNSDWIFPSFIYKTQQVSIEFTRQFLLSDIGLEDRGDHFLLNYFDRLFQTIDFELQNNRFVIISLNSGPSQWHMEVIYKKISERLYNTVTFYWDQINPKIWTHDLKDRIHTMKGTDIITYKIKENIIKNGN